MRLFIKVIYIGFLCFCINLNAKSQSLKNNETYHILFIGNSLTYTNNLPDIVKKLAKKKGVSVQTKMVAFPNYAIEDHWNDNHVQKLITSKLYDFVIIQQGPSSQFEGREMLIHYGKKFSDLCQKNNATLVYFMVWPPLNHPDRFEGVIKNHEDAANLNNALLCPVGSVWKAYFDATGNFDYYGADGFHPSKKGSEIAAQVIINTLFT